MLSRRKASACTAPKAVVMGFLHGRRMNNWDRIKAHYAAVEGLSLVANEWSIDPYAWDDGLGIRLTPIEAKVWEHIRSLNMVLYPQYPISGFLVDFANPAAKVAIECDGAAYHTDVAKDLRRQREIELAGWTVYRFSGSMCAREAEEGMDDETGHSVYTEPPILDNLRHIGERHGITRMRQCLRLAA